MCKIMYCFVISRILLLDSGEIKEFEAPDVLLQDKSSSFYAMARDAGVIA